MATTTQPITRAGDPVARGRGPLRAALALSCLVLAPHVGQAAAASGFPAEGTTYAGRSLEEALLDLRLRGLKLVFTSNLVRPEMAVASEPTAADLRDVLDELLAPHGLMARDGPGGTVVVVPEGGVDRRSSIHGVVRGWADGAPLAGAAVVVLESDRAVTSDADGVFEIADLPPGTFTLEAGADGFLPRVERVAVASGERAEVSFLLEPALMIEDELLVTPSRLSLLREEPVGHFGLSREEILALPHLGDDFFRAITLLPGATANDVTAQFHVRGGRRDETQLLLDGQELYEAFHLKDFDSALSFVAPATLDSADLITGGFPARYGDRMGGVLDMTTVAPTGSPRVRIGVGIPGAHVGGRGSFGDGRGGWIAEARRGSLDLVGQLLGDEEPQYWDAFAKLDYRFGRRHGLRGNLLHSGDEFEFSEVVEDESKRVETEYRSSYSWLTQQALFREDLLLETSASLAQIDRDRRGVEQEEDVRFTILDRRDSEVLGLRQAFTLQAAPKNSLSWGWELRRFETEYDYLGDGSFDDPLAAIRHDGGEVSTFFQGHVREEHGSLHLTDRLRPLPSLTLELGLRFDRHTQVSESVVSPRLHVAYALGEGSVLRVAWGRFTQSQRPYELQVEDGETAFHPIERSEHRVVGFDKVFPSGPGGRGLALRAEAYRREVSNPRPRYENLFEPINTFPEVEPDRVLIAARQSIAEGVEVFLRGDIGPRARWWVNYTWATTEDDIQGVRIPRLFDQTHALNLDLDVGIGDRWRVNVAWRYHTGWPTTPLSVEEGAGEEGETAFVPVLGPLNSERVSPYHRLDLRVSRRWRWRAASVDLFFDVQNVYDRKNVAGFDYELDEDEGALSADTETWPGVLPSVGVSVEF